MYFQRNEIEKCIKEYDIDRKRFFEVSKHSYEAIIRNIENAFVDKSRHWDADIHWANMGYYNPNLKCVYRTVENEDWLDELLNIIPIVDLPVYVLIEGVKNYGPKYWLYEAYISELMLILKESYLWGDFYIVSKKFDWLISLNHHDIVSYVGETLKISSS